MISYTLFIILMCVAGVVLLTLLAWGMKKLFKLKVGISIIIGLVVVPIVLGGVVMGVMSPNSISVVDAEGGTAYLLFGEEMDYAMADNTTLNVKTPEMGEYIINNTADTIVIQRITYSTGGGTDLSNTFVIMIAPYTGYPADDVWIKYLMTDPPKEIETDSYGDVTHFWLRKMTEDDAATWYFYEGETFDGQPHGYGKFMDLETMEVQEGQWEDGEYLGE